MGPTIEEPILAAAGVRKRFGALAVLDGVDFALGAGEAVGIVGPNGAGKTTLLNVLAGALRPSEGSVRFRGADVSRLAGQALRARDRAGPPGPAAVRRHDGVRERLRRRRDRRPPARAAGVRPLHRRARAVRPRRVANRRAESLGLLHRKRLELARALATDPVVLLLDEIGGGLTDAEAVELVGTIPELRAQGIAIVWIEHIVHVLVQVVERLVCMDAGRVIADGDPAAVMQDAAVVDAYLGSSAA